MKITNGKITKYVCSIVIGLIAYLIWYNFLRIPGIDLLEAIFVCMMISVFPILMSIVFLTDVIGMDDDDILKVVFLSGLVGGMLGVSQLNFFGNYNPITFNILTTIIIIFIFGEILYWFEKDKEAVNTYKYVAGRKGANFLQAIAIYTVITLVDDILLQTYKLIRDNINVILKFTGYIGIVIIGLVVTYYIIKLWLWVNKLKVRNNPESREEVFSCRYKECSRVFTTKSGRGNHETKTHGGLKE